MMTHKERIRAAVRGAMPDALPYVPRIDLWYNANSLAGTLPDKHKDRSRDEIALAEGWALFKMLPDMLDLRGPEDIIHRAIGIHPTRTYPYRVRFPADVRIKVDQSSAETRVEYHTPVGVVSTKTYFPEELRMAGSTYPVITEHAIKGQEDYAVLAHIFANLKVMPDYDDFVQWELETGDNGFCCATATFAASPMHHIQRDFLDPTSFFLHYNDFHKEMRSLAEAIEVFYEQILNAVADSPAQGVCWGGNYDDMITYAPYFEKELLPWLQKAGDVLHDRGKIIDCHCDGENLGLMEVIKAANIDVAEAVCPYPMTKVTIGEYYRRWGEKTTIFGGIPSNILVAELTTDEEFEAYLDDMFTAIAPGRRFVVGIADTTPPDAVFDRLIRIGERVEKEGRLPLQAGGADPVSEKRLARATARVAADDSAASAAVSPVGGDAADEDSFQTVSRDVLNGDVDKITADVRTMIDQGYTAQEIMDCGLLPAMEFIGARFTDGTVFIPEVLLSARAMNAAVAVLEPYLASEDKAPPAKVMIGTVKGDLHDIGKNMVLTMMRSVGFEAIDLGINVPVETFVAQVNAHRPAILGLSALLTTTMPQMKRVLDALAEAGIRDEVKVIIGGAPVNQRYAKNIGADGYARDAGEAVAIAKNILNE